MWGSKSRKCSIFPLDFCAERVAIYHASALFFPNQIIDAIAITGTAQEPTALAPCRLAERVDSLWQNTKLDKSNL
ncbi:hypothetical protein CCAN11_1970017 [Capnocytophaga canimorsus]|uniref:Uncharacterized protein n=1 Tax=Capnocytophaga canimorsus TaxID=28188 RepID=A0A0B7ID40_9FLAO|nr:hypothetical protein CCAN11_1970017 [Capnocytophaga canimorsus]